MLHTDPKMTVILGSLFIAYRECISFLFLKLIEKWNTCLNPQLVFHKSDKAQKQKGKICPILQYEVMSGMNWVHCLPATQIYWSRCDGFLDMAFPQYQLVSCSMRPLCSCQKGWFGNPVPKLKQTKSDPFFNDIWMSLIPMEVFL